MPLKTPGELPGVFLSGGKNHEFIGYVEKRHDYGHEG